MTDHEKIALLANLLKQHGRPTTKKRHSGHNPQVKTNRYDKLHIGIKVTN